MERCPICRAALNGAETCRRCRAELASVLAAEQTAQRLADLAMLRLALDDRAAAVRLLRRSRLLHRTPEALALLPLAAASPAPATGPEQPLRSSRWRLLDGRSIEEEQHPPETTASPPPSGSSPDDTDDHR